MTFQGVLTNIWNWFKWLFAEIHSFITTALNFVHTYLKIVLGIAWKVAILLFVVDILFKTKFGVFDAAMNIIVALSKITVGGFIAIGAVAVIVAVVVVIVEQLQKIKK